MTTLAIIGSILEPFLISVLVAGMFYIVVRGWKSLFGISKGSIESAVKNIALAIFNTFLVILFFGSFADLAKDIFASWIPVLPESAWDNIALPFSVPIVLIAADFANYWAHRILHHRAFWGIHALHHSDRNMNWTTSYRVHILEHLQMIIIAAFFIGWLQLPTEAAVIAGVIRLWYSKYVHCQLGWNHGAFGKVLASPNYHRWHHANRPEAFGKNLCDMFPVWDILFGTYYNPGLCDAELGADDAPDEFLLAQIYPFRYWLEGVIGKTDPAPQETTELVQPSLKT